MTECFAMWLIHVCLKLKISPLMPIEERFEYGIKHIEKRLTEIRMPRQLTKAQEKQQLSEFHNQNNISLTKKLSWDNQLTVKPKQYVFYCPCCLFKQSYYHAIKKQDIGEVSVKIRSYFASFNIKHTIHSDSLNANFTSHLYLAPNGGYLFSSEPLYQCRSKNSVNCKLPQDNQIEFDKKNTYYICECGANNVYLRKAEVQIRHSATNYETFKRIMEKNDINDWEKSIDYFVPASLVALVKRKFIKLSLEKQVQTSEQRIQSINKRVQRYVKFQKHKIHKQNISKNISKIQTYTNQKKTHKKIK